MKKKIVFLLMIVGMKHGILQSDARNTINEIFHHQGHPQGKQLEYGKVVFYFTHVPSIKQQALQHKNAKEELVLILPGTTAQETLYAFKGEREKLYKVSIERAEKEKFKDAVRVVIQYDPERVVPEYALFDSISVQKGLVIRFHNKELLNNIKNQRDTALRVVSRTDKPLVVIDIGHGGSDLGTVGCNKVCEKDIVLDVGLTVAQLLEQRGIQVKMTRIDDIFVPLDVRTTFANGCSAHALVSIHANSGKKEARGIETFCMHSSLFSHTTSVPEVSYSSIAQPLLHHVHNLSNNLAQAVHTNTLDMLRMLYTEGICDRHVKHSVSQVLLGSAMPSTLIEIGFLSNPQEADRLATAHYRTAVAHGICNGIIEFLKIA
jgi:N-acetylmuramoyl-L-alanine amidase